MLDFSFKPWSLPLLLWVVWLPVASAQPATQSDPESWRARRSALEQQFKTDLDAIAVWCRQNGMEQRVEPTLEWIQDRDLGRQYIFLPGDLGMPAPGVGLEGEWQGKLNTARVKHAERILELAKQASDENAGAVAFQWLHEVLIYDRDHAGVRKMLGHKKRPEGWRVASDKLRIKPTNMPHDIVNWPAKQYIRMQTPHFIIESSATEARTRVLAEKLERWHSVWRQVFFEYWNSPTNVKRWIQGKGALRISNKKYRVVFFQDQAEYIRQLHQLVPGIEGSTGYYVSSDRVSFFFDGSEQDQATWRHELTHQLFRETRRTNLDAFETQFIWLDEGIAMYLESLADFGDHVTLGGFESRRLQFARIRRLLEGFHVPLKRLSVMGRTELQRQSRGDLIRLYTESAGLTDMLMNDREGAYEKQLIEFLRLAYQGRVKATSFEKIIGRKFDQLDAAYLEYLEVDAELVEKHLGQPEMLKELSLSGTVLQPGSFKAIGQCLNLTMLDLSNNSLRKVDLESLSRCQQIKQLILTRCRFEEESLRGLEIFPNLDDLDLSGSSVQDSQLASFKNLKRLRTLKIAKTAISDRGLEQLADVANLVALDVSGTKVTPEGIAKLQSRLPNLQVVR